MTSNLGSHSINVKLTGREWVGVGAFLISTAIGFAAVYAQAKSVEAKAIETAQDLSDFKSKTEGKLDRLIEMVGVLNGRLSVRKAENN